MIEQPKEKEIQSQTDTILIEKANCLAITKTETTHKLLTKYGFIRNGLGLLDCKPHSIELFDKIYFAYKFFQPSEKLKAAIDAEIRCLEKEGVIRPSCSEFFSRAFPILKRNGEV